MQMIESVLGNITSNKGLSGISVRGEIKATAQWLMYCMVHNIETLWKNSEIESWAWKKDGRAAARPNIKLSKRMFDSISDMFEYLCQYYKAQ